MTTNNFGGSAADFGLPSELELESLANSLLSDIDGSLFEPEVCAEGIEELVTNGDTGVFDTAANKASKVFGGQLKTQDFENIIDDLKREAGYDELSGVASEYSGLTDIGGGFRELEDQTSTYERTDANKRSQHTGYAPQVISQQQAASGSDLSVRTTADDRNVIPAKDNAGVDSRTVGGQKGNSQIVIGTKTLEQIRQDFPILQEKVNGNPLIWLDNGATTQRPRQVIDRLSYYYEHENSNVHRGAHTLAAKSTDAYEKARQTVADFIGAPSKDNVVFVRGTTEGINLVAHSYVKPLLQPGDEIIVSLLEHHANIVPWQLVAQETGAVIKVIPVDESGQLILPEYEKLFTKRTKFVSVTHVSNVLGTITPVAELIAIAHRHGVRILIDGAQSIAHIPINVTALDADWFVFSGHKVYAPTGIGAVYGKKEVLEEAKPYHGGGNMIQDVTFERTIYNPAPNKFEAGTGSIGDAVGLGAALDYLNGIGMPAVSKYEHELVTYGMKELGKIQGLHLIGTAANKSSALSFVIDGVSNDAVGQKLDQNGIAVRVGHHCAQPILRHYGLESVVRPTLALYNSFEDIDTLAKVLRSL
ncbi:MAG: SufS family cysteine desulfurase [Clostridia bacterium]|nr:SufS family cysteine desulfurase [Clostridia bacterium]